MTWNASFPLDNTKLRLAPSGIRGNFDAIEKGNVPSRRLKLVQQASNPTREANRGFLFTKLDASTSTTELWYLNDKNPADSVQLTQSGKVGASTSPARFQEIWTTTSTFGNNQDAFISAWGNVSAGGTLGSSYNIASVTHPLTGVYNITMSKTLNITDYPVIVTVKSTTAQESTYRVRSLTATTFSVDIFDDGVSDSREFSFVVLGGRIGV